MTDRRPFRLQERPGWLLLSFERTQRMLSWSISRPGFQDAHQVAWVQVRNSDLTPGSMPTRSCTAA